MMNKKIKHSSLFTRVIRLITKFWEYCSGGVWRDTRNTLWVRIVKTANLTVRSFFDADLQTRSMSLTYMTVLAIVPAFALLFAIGRGFGLQSSITEFIYSAFPAQHKAIDTAISFVDRYLKESSQGIFVGVGLVILLWTLISLLSSIESTFNKIWGIRQDRSFYRKITDYTAICLFIPILMICSSGVSIFVSSTVTNSFAFLTPVVNSLLDAAPFFFACLAFTLSFFLIPNTKVKFKYAAIAGLLCGCSFQIVQLLFVNGQIYVSKYNAIYGSFAFLPLLLIWLQLSWLILLTGSLLTYSAQNVFGFNYMGDLSNIAESYMKKVAVVTMAVIIHRFESGQQPFTQSDIASKYGLPIRLVSIIIDKLNKCRLVYIVQLGNDKLGIAPAVDNDKYTVGMLLSALDKEGMKDFIPLFKERYSEALTRTDEIIKTAYDKGNDLLLRDICLPAPLVVKG